MGSEEKFLSRHGELAMLSIIEDWERSQGLDNKTTTSFEQRWDRFLQMTTVAIPVAIVAQSGVSF